MNIRERIGSRIAEVRKSRGITIKELSSRTEFSSARICNWEQGARSPGPVEAMTLSKLLEVSASYLLCISDDPRGDLTLHADVMPRFIPLLSHQQAQLPVEEIKQLIRSVSCFDNADSKIVLDTNAHPNASVNCFAMKVEDNSMSPEFSVGDLCVVDLDRVAQPGDFVLALVIEKGIIVIRKYRENNDLSGIVGHLIALNPDWANIDITKDNNIQILGVVIEHRRCFK